MKSQQVEVLFIKEKLFALLGTFTVCVLLLGFFASAPQYAIPKYGFVWLPNKTSSVWRNSKNKVGKMSLIKYCTKFNGRKLILSRKVKGAFIRIRDIFYGSGPSACSFLQWLSIRQNKVFSQVYSLITYWRFVYISLQR